MILFPAIDLRNNQCVRLIQGDYDRLTVYSNQPVDIAKSFENDGAKYLHVVDLDAAKDNSTHQNETIKKIVASVDIPVQVGGGVHTIERAKALFDLGVERVILGTAVIENFDFVVELAQEYQDRVIVSIDAKHGMVATKGWTNITHVSAIELCKKLEQAGIKTIVYTDISKDGMLTGPNFEDYEKLSRVTQLNIIASGGVSRLSDLVRLNEIGLYGAIIGKALYEKKFTMKEALLCLQNASSPV